MGKTARQNGPILLSNGGRYRLVACLGECEIADRVSSEVRLLGHLLAGLRKAIGNDGVRGRIEGKANMRAGNLEVDVGISREAVVPIDDAVAASVDGCLHHRVWYAAAQRIEKVASAAAGVAGGKHLFAMFFEDVPADSLRRLQHRS